MKIRARAKVTKTFNDFGDGGITYHKGVTYNAEQNSDSCIKLGQAFL